MAKLRVYRPHSAVEGQYVPVADGSVGTEAGVSICRRKRERGGFVAAFESIYGDGLSFRSAFADLKRKSPCRRLRSSFFHAMNRVESVLDKIVEYASSSRTEAEEI